MDHRQGGGGFTLIEMLAVLGIIGIMMVIAVGAFNDIGRGQGLRGSVLNLRSSLSLARQYAITHRERTTFAYANGTNAAGKTTGYFAITNSAGKVLGATNYLTDGIRFVLTQPEERVLFRYDGSCDKSGSWDNNHAGGPAKEIVVQEDRSKNTLTATTVVYRLTGQAKSKVWVDD